MARKIGVRSERFVKVDFGKSTWFDYDSARFIAENAFAGVVVLVCMGQATRLSRQPPMRHTYWPAAALPYAFSLDAS